MGKVKLFPTPEYTASQPRDPVVPKLPCTGMLLGPSKSGKTVALISQILEQYRGCFERIYIFSPSINVDDGWKPVKKYIEEVLKVFFFATGGLTSSDWSAPAYKLSVRYSDDAVTEEVRD